MGKRVAVVAVHGVGDQLPKDTARRISDLLQGLRVRPGGNDPVAQDAGCAEYVTADVAYAKATEHELRIPIRPVRLRTAPGPTDGEPTHASKAVARAAASRTRGPFSALVNERLTAARAQPAGRQPVAAEPADVAQEFMRGKLSACDDMRRYPPYETIRIETGRQDDVVHVYELYWADLSRLKAGLLSIFTELYQVLFHLPSVGAHAVDAETYARPRSNAWRIFRFLHHRAVGLLTVPIPILSAFIGVIGAAVIAMAALERYVTAPEVHVAIATGLVAAVALAACGAWLWRRATPSPRFVWLGPLLAFLIIAVTGATLAATSHISPAAAPAAQWLEIGALILVALGAAFGVLAIYDRRRPHVLFWATRLLVLVAIAMAVGGCLAARTSQYGTAGWISRPLGFALNSFEALDVIVTVVWLVYFFCAILAAAAGAVTRASDAPGGAARRTFWTACLTLGVPALLLLGVALTLWGLVAEAAKPLFQNEQYVSLAHMRHDLWLRQIGTWPSITVTGGIEELLRTGLTVLVPWIALVLLISLVPAIWGLVPAVWTELAPPMPGAAGSPKSERLGRWLTLALSTALLASGILLFMAITFAIPGIALWQGYSVSGGVYAIQLLGTLSAGIFAVLLAARGSLRKAALGFRPILDVLLDIDNWLREHPLGSNPTSRILARYVSLLRTICGWTDLSGSHYDAIVIVAHSQGSAITADLFRFMTHEYHGRYAAYDPGLARLQDIKITFFTMGCPLRQLYGLRFPNLYDWAFSSPGGGTDTWSPNDLSPDDPKASPVDLGMARWSNAYRSGDYVGRSLWRSAQCGYLWTQSGLNPAVPLENVSSDGKARREFCIGAGAHLHYWDETAPAIAAELDRLIQTA